LAPTAVSSGGLTARDIGRVSGGVRYRYVDSRPADSTNSIVASGYMLAEVFARYDLARVSFVATVDNLFNAPWNEAQFATTSRLKGEPLTGITELNFTPGNPRTIQVGIEYRLHAP
jgi:outer membrane receptor protein involved in Fe transport